MDYRDTSHQFSGAVWQSQGFPVDGADHGCADPQPDQVFLYKNHQILNPKYCKDQLQESDHVEWLRVEDGNGAGCDDDEDGVEVSSPHGFVAANERDQQVNDLRAEILTKNG